MPSDNHVTVPAATIPAKTDQTASEPLSAPNYIKRDVANKSVQREVKV